jgi:hypothetical protein
VGIKVGPHDLQCFKFVTYISITEPFLIKTIMYINEPMKIIKAINESNVVSMRSF